MDDLRPDLMERARAMTTSRTANHPWKSMSDEELLRSAGLILKDPERQLEGITLAAILLFGKDSTILSVLPQHKTDAIFRVENLDRYDDRDVIITNLLETYDRLIAFGQKHLSDPFVQEGLQSVSARDRILREIFSNSLAHRDYSSGYVAKFRGSAGPDCGGKGWAAGRDPSEDPSGNPSDTYRPDFSLLCRTALES